LLPAFHPSIFSSPKIASPAKTPKKGFSVFGTPTTTPSKAFDRLASIEIVTALPDDVTHREQLDILAEIYASCLSGLHKLFPSGY
jgi:hypothetical protein